MKIERYQSISVWTIELIADIDDIPLFQAIYNNCHVLISLLPNEKVKVNIDLYSASSWEPHL